MLVDLFPSKIGAITHATGIRNVTYTPTYVDVTLDGGDSGDDGSPSPARAYRLLRCGCDAAAVADASRTTLRIPPRGVYVGPRLAVEQLVTGLRGIDRLSGVADAAAHPPGPVRSRWRAGLLTSLAAVSSPPTAPPGDGGGGGGGGLNYSLLADLSPPPLAILPASAAADVPPAPFGDAIGVPLAVLLTGEAGEASPLGAAEYIKLWGLVVDKPAAATAAFATIKAGYAAASAAAAAAPTVPSVLLGAPDGVADRWRLGRPGSASGRRLGALCADAGVARQWLDGQGGGGGGGGSGSVPPAVAAAANGTAPVAAVAAAAGAASVWIDALDAAAARPAATADDVLVAAGGGVPAGAGGGAPVKATDAAVADRAAARRRGAARLAAVDALPCGRVYVLALRGGAAAADAAAAARPDRLLADVVRAAHAGRGGPLPGLPGAGFFFYKRLPAWQPPRLAVDAPAAAACPSVRLPEQPPTGMVYGTVNLAVAGTDRKPPLAPTLRTLCATGWAPPSVAAVAVKARQWLSPSPPPR
ncbi:hypothetical protein I4F81_007844 [Pyropia yezoensis]|uniref:Uncharacterized protein n=1 Tax=Pyropia yezoensis TaxID=2788 RepID=A0ACC3C6F0_PYRYE|nr:hypothetical protein I4F81_007844 [Neopyropia yezoensis]